MANYRINRRKPTAAQTGNVEVLHDAHNPHKGKGKGGKGKGKAPAQPGGGSKGAFEDHRPWGSEGVIVSIGPDELSDDQLIDSWVTFHMTPEILPVAHAANWTSLNVVGAGEFIGWGGRNLDTVTFSGQLEPPEYWVQGAPGGRSFERQFLEQAIIDAGGRVRDDEAADAPYGFAVPQDGAHTEAGPDNPYIEAHAMKEWLEALEKHGCIIRLVIGDRFGFNDLAVIEAFTWRYEDPDPDTLYYDISFKEFREHDSFGAEAGQDPRFETYTTKKNDTLRKISQHAFGTGSKWRTILNLNRRVIGGLWWYPDQANPHPQPNGKLPPNWRSSKRGSIGDKLSGRHDGFQIGFKRIDGKKEIIDPDLEFRAGVVLRIKAKKKKGHKKGDNGNGKKGTKNAGGGKGSHKKGN